MAIVVKSTPGISMLIVPSLIGFPVAFFPLPRPHFATFALPAAPTAEGELDWLPPAAHATSTKASTLVAARTMPAFRFVEFILPP